jgi:hypothetical protein
LGRIVAAIIGPRIETFRSGGRNSRQNLRLMAFS